MLLRDKRKRSAARDLLSLGFGNALTILENPLDRGDIDAC